MKVSELIKELEDFLKLYGDFDVVKSGQYLGSESVDNVIWIRNQECLIANEWLDNYTLTTLEKLNNVDEKLMELLENRKCNECGHYFIRDDEKFCGYWGNNVNGDEKVNDDNIKLYCFEYHNGLFDNPKKLNYELMKIQYCKGVLEKELKKEMIEW